MIPPKIVRVDEKGRLNIDQFSDLIDVARVEYYEIVATVKENTMKIYFYDKHGEVIEPSPKGRPSKRNRRATARKKAA